jgi:uncharacterized protein YndB with AHSA1/START domain
VIEFTVQTRIARSLAEVFAYVADPSKLARWQTNTVSVVQEGEGPLRLGTRLREVHRGPGGREVESLVEVSELEPDRTFALKMIEGPLLVHAHITFEPTGAGTLMRFRVHGQPEGAMRLAQPLLRLALKRQFAQHCATLKSVLEAADESDRAGAAS